jgi:hypothetical protein
MNTAGDRFSEPPSYDDVVARYGLHILNHGSDFQLTANGDVALTADGDLKLGDNKFNSMFRLVVGWRFRRLSPSLSEQCLSRILLDVLCGGTYEELNRKFFEFADSMID